MNFREPAPSVPDADVSADRIAKLKVPVVHGAADSLIPPALGRALYEKAAAPKRFVLVEGGTHYSTSGRGQQQYREALRALYGWGGVGRIATQAHYQRPD